MSEFNALMGAQDNEYADDESNNETFGVLTDPVYWSENVKRVFGVPENSTESISHNKNIDFSALKAKYFAVCPTVLIDGTVYAMKMSRTSSFDEAKVLAESAIILYSIDEYNQTFYVSGHWGDL